MTISVETQRPISPSAGRGGLSRWARRNALQLGVIAVALFLWVLFMVGAPGTFSRFDIYNALLTTTPYFGMIAIPLTLVVIAAEIDLSFGSIMAWGMTAYAWVATATGNYWLGFAACLLAGLFAGLVNGFAVVRIGVPSLVATIGTQFLWAGIAILVTNAKGLGMTNLQETMLYTVLVGKVGDLIPMQFVWMILIGLATWFLLNRTQFGAHVYLSGDNVDSARLMGVDVDRVKVTVFALVGVTAAFAGFVQSLALFYFWPTIGGGYLMNTLASVFLGGTSVFGGTGTVFGTFVASFIINAINPGIVAVGLTQYYTQIIYGLIIVVSVSLQSLVRRRLS